MSQIAHTHRRSGDRLDVAVAYQLVIGNRQDLKIIVLDALADGARDIVLDFGEVVYCDSAGCGVLVTIAKKVHDAGGTIRLVGVGADIALLFELTRIDTIFDGVIPDTGPTADRPITIEAERTRDPVLTDEEILWILALDPARGVETSPTAFARRVEQAVLKKLDSGAP